jgi:hypothetical protein
VLGLISINYSKGVSKIILIVNTSLSS